jgi:hypothetical protein
MPRHPNVVEADDPGRARRILRRNEQAADEDIRAADEDIRAARLVDDRGPELIELASEPVAACRKRSRSELRSASDDHPRRFAARVRIDDFDLVHDWAGGDRVGVAAPRCHDLGIGQVSDSR